MNGQKSAGDATRLLALSRGDPAAFEELVQSEFGVIFAIALSRLRNRESAEDLAQEVLLRAWLHMGPLRDDTRLTAYLAQITRHLATDWLQRDLRTSRFLTMIPINEDQDELPDISQRWRGTFYCRCPSTHKLLGVPLCWPPLLIALRRDTEFLPQHNPLRPGGHNSVS